MPLISVVSPVYRAENIVSLLVARIVEAVAPLGEYEIILVEDGSKDDSWGAIERECRKNSAVKGIKLSRNFGQHYAITAGLDYALGEWVVVMDCDLQDDPAEIPALLQRATQENFDVVLARRRERADHYLKRLSSTLFYSTLGYLTDTKQDPSIANFGIYHSKVIAAIRQMREPIRYFPTMVRWVGFRRTTIDVKHAARTDGSSTYNLSRLLRLAMDIILANSAKPITLMMKLGFLISLGSFLFSLVTLVRYFFGYIHVFGYASIILAISFFSGIIIGFLGVIGLYVSKTFEGVKNRPVYIVDKTRNK